MNRPQGANDGKRAAITQIRKHYGWDGVNAQRWSKSMLQTTMQEPSRFGLNLSEMEGVEQDGRYGSIKKAILNRLGVPSWMNLEDLRVDGQSVTLFDLLVMPPELLDERLEDGSFLHTLFFGRAGANPWKVQILNREFPVPAKVTAQCLQLLAEWQEVFPREETFAQTHFGVPSLLVRFDCVWHETTGLGVYEIEDRPAGVGITTLVNQQFRELFLNLREEWPEFSAVVSPLRWPNGGDDHLWLREISVEEARKNKELLWVRAEPWERALHEFAPRSVSTVQTEGLKSYGVPLGLWSEIRIEDGTLQLPWSEGFCIKPLQGSKTQKVFIWDPQAYTPSGRERALYHLKSLGTAYLQRFIPPMPLKIGERQYNAIWRIFFGWSPRLREWVTLGGEWDARPAPHSLIHGALDAITGSSLLA